MFNVRQFTVDIATSLQAAPSLIYVPAKAEWKMHLQQEVDVATALQTGRNGRAGALCVVEMPEPESAQNNISGVIEDQHFNVMVIEQVDINMAQGGTNIFAEEICQRVKDILHLWADDLYGTIKLAGKTNFVRDANRFPGCMVYSIPFVLPKCKSTQTQRCSTVQIVNNSGVITMTCATVTATIFYTLDGTTPTNQDGGNANSVQYSAPFNANAGTLIRAAAFEPTMNQSEQRSIQL
jgi:Fn3 associated